jgi:DNA-binding transcriptional LysR family regulator
MTRELMGGIDIFLTIVREGSLRAAARALGIGAPAVSHQLKSLESRLGVTLLVRTTRSLELTEAGRTLLAGAGPAFEEIGEAVERARAAGKSTIGTLRLTMPASAYAWLVAPMLAEFQELYPEIRLELSINEGLVDPVRDGFHAGFRLGDLLSPEMVALRLTGPVERCYVASPAYLDTHGRPAHPRDLLGHKCIRYKLTTANRLQDWQFTEDGQTRSIEAPSQLVFDDMDTLRAAVRAGHGIGWSLRAVLEKEIAAGALETVLDNFTVRWPPYYLFFPEQNRRLEILRVFVDLLAATCAAQTVSGAQ